MNPTDLTPSAVIDATNQIGNQEALELARAADPSGHRTIGVLTKCDAIQPGEEKKVVRVARNKVHRLAQGWFAVRNASPQERRDGLLSDPEVRDATEAAFFASRGDAWAKLSRGRTGLAALRGFLRDTVDALLQESIDRLMREIQRLSLGPAPSTVGIANSVDIADEKHHLHAVSEVASGAGLVSASASSGELGLAKETEGDDDVEAGPGRKRPTVLINACTVALCLILVMTLVGFSCKQLAQEIATDGNWFRLLLLVTAPLQVFVSLVGPLPRLQHIHHDLDIDIS